jgi:hypothetical protein
VVGNYKEENYVTLYSSEMGFEALLLNHFSYIYGRKAESRTAHVF